MANPDFRLIVGADVSASYDQMKSDLKQVISMLDKDPAKIKLGLDSATIGGLRKDIKSALDSSKMNANIGLKFDNGAIKEFTDKITGSLSEISKLVSEISQKNLGINLNVSDANSVQEQVAGVRGEVLAYAKALEEAQRIMADLNNNNAAKNAIKAQGVDFGKAIGTLVNYRTELTRITDSIEKQNTMTGLRVRRDELEQLRVAIMPVLEAAQKLGVINIDMSKFVPPEIPASAVNTADQIMTALRGIGAVAPAVSEAGQALSQDAAAAQTAASAEKLKGDISAEVSRNLLNEASAAERSAAASEKDAAAAERSAAAADKDAAATNKAAESKGKARKAAEQSDEEYYAKADRLEAEYYAKQERLREEAEAKKNAQIEEGIRKHNEALDKQAAAEEAAIAARTKREVGIYDGMDRQLEKLGSTANIDRLSAQLEIAKTKMDALSESTAAMQENYSKLEGYLATLNNPDASLDEKKNAAEGFRATLSALNEQIRAVSTSERERAKAGQEAAEKAKAAADAEKNRDNLLTQSYKLLDQVTAAQKNWTKAAKDPATAEAYERLGKTHGNVEKLINDLKNADLSKLDPEQVQKFATRLAALKREAAESSSAIKSFGNNVKSYFGNGLSQLKNRLSYTLGFAQIVMKTVQEIKKMISTAVELDTAMNQLQIVTRGSSDDMAAYAKNVSQMAKETAQSTKDLIDATTVYARLGYTMDESASLAKYTAMLQGVGDIDASAAQNAMTAIIKAFGKDVSEIESIMDKMVIVGNNFPISVSQIAEGMNNAGSSLSASGNSLEQSIALLTAANTTIQNISKSSTGLRTIAARIRKTTVELDDLGETIETAKYQKVIDMLTGKGVNLTENGQYRSTYDILKDIAGIWNELSSMEKAGIAEQLAGTRQQNVFFSIIEQFREAENAMDRMGSSAGALQESYDIYLDSIQAHVNQLKAAYDALARSFVNSDFAKGAVDVLRMLLEVLTKITDAIGPGGLIASVAALTVGFKALTGTLNPKVVIPIASFFINTLGPGLATLGEFVQFFIPALSGVAAGAVGLGAVAAGLIAVAGAIALVVAGVKAYKAAHPSYEDLKKSADEARKSVNDLNSKIEANEARIKEINAIKDDEKFSEASDELHALEEQNERYREQLTLLEQIADAKDKAVIEKGLSDANKAFNSFVSAPRDITYTNLPGTYGAPITVESSNGLGGMLNQIDRVTAAQERVREISKEIADYQEDRTKLSTEEVQDLLDRARQANESLISARAGLVEFQDQLLEIREKFLAAGAEDSVEKVDEYLRMIADAAGTSDKSFNKFKEDIKSLSYDLKAAVKNGKSLTEEQIRELLRLGYTANDVRSYLTRLAKESSEAVDGATRSNLADLATIQDELAKTSEAWEEYNKITSSEKGDQAEQMKSAWEKALEDINAGKIDSNSVWGAAKLIFSDEQLAGMGYNLNKIATQLSGPFMQALFGGGEDADIGINFANYIRDNADAFGDAVHILDNGDGTFKFWYDSLEKLANGLGISEDAATMLLDSLDAFGVQSMRSTEDIQQIADRYYQLFHTLRDTKEAASELASELAHDGANEAQVMDVLSNLRDSGIINMTDEEFAAIVKEAFDSLDDLDDETAEPTITADASPAQAVIDNIVSQLEALNNSVYSPTISTNVQDNSSSTTGGSTPNGLRTGSGGTRLWTDAAGTRDAPEGDAVVNEKGPELIADNGIAYIANGGKPGITHLSKGAVVFTAEETEKIFTRHYSKIPIRSFADGTAPSTTKASIRDRLLGGRKIKSAYTGGISATFTCIICGYSWRYGLLDNPGGPNATCPKCGARYANGAYQGGGNKAGTVGHENDDYYPYYAHKSHGGAQIPGYDDIWNNYVNNGSYGPQDSNYGTGQEHQKKCPSCGRSTAWGAITCKYCGYNFVLGYNPSNRRNVKTEQDVLGGARKNGSRSNVGTGGGGSVGHADYGSHSDPSKVDWIAVALNRIQRAAAALEKVASSGFKKLSTRINATKEEMSELTDEIEKQQAGYTRYLSEAESVGLSEDLAAKVREGAIEISEYDEETRKLINEYSEWYEKALDCKYAVEDLHQEIAQLYMDNFQNTQTDYENRLSETEHLIEMINKDISMAQTRGYIDSANFYSSLAGNTADQIATLRYELSDLNRYFKEAMDSGEIEEGSEAWYEMKQAINDVEESLADANIQLEEYKNKVREINWGYFDYAQSRISKISEEANFLINLMSNDKLFQDNGQFNDLGQATAGMHVINYDTYMAQADEYAKEMRKIQQELADDPYNKTLIERRDELLDLQRQSIIAAEGEKNAMKDLVAEGIQLELSALQELISAYENSLDSAKELYDYQQKVAKQTGDIAALEKQLSAYQNDTSEENRARVQKLQQQLKDARQSLSDTEYDKSISDQKQLLSDLYNEYEEALNSRLDNVDALMAEMINGANANREAIIQTISSVSGDVGYVITDGLSNVMHEQFANYDGMFENITGIHTELVRIYDLIAAMASASGAVKAYAKGGLIDYTGLAAVHGTPGNPEMVLSAADTAKFLEAAALMRGAPRLSDIRDSGIMSGIGNGGTVINGLSISIPIEHVQDYNDMIAQMQRDPKFDRLVNAITLDRVNGKSNLSKYGVKFG